MTDKALVTLTKRRIVKTMLVARELLQDPDLHVDEFFADRVRVGVTGFLWAQDVGETRLTS